MKVKNCVDTGKDGAIWHWSIKHDLKRELKHLPRDIK